VHLIILPERIDGHRIRLPAVQFRRDQCRSLAQQRKADGEAGTAGLTIGMAGDHRPQDIADGGRCQHLWCGHMVQQTIQARHVNAFDGRIRQVDFGIDTGGQGKWAIGSGRSGRSIPCMPTQSRRDGIAAGSFEATSGSAGSREFIAVQSQVGNGSGSLTQPSGPDAISASLSKQLSSAERNWSCGMSIPISTSS